MVKDQLVPIGVMPQFLWREKRIQDLKDAINRYWDAGLTPDDRWNEELNLHLRWLQERKVKQDG
jgi:hypothetical protein